MPGFSDVLGHEQTIAHMKSAIEANKVSHAYLLAGEKGSGKKMLAGIFARTLQCEAHGSEPCGKCHSCIQAESGNQPDIIYVTHDQEEAMSISDMIVVMKDGVVQQIGKPQDVYDSPVNLFVAKFLGTPPINVFEGQIRGGSLYIGENAVLLTPGISDQPVSVGIRPEGFIPDEKGALCCQLGGMEVMGRDISVVSTHASSVNPVIRSIISSDTQIRLDAKTVRFSIKPNKIFLFRHDTGERINL